MDLFTAIYSPVPSTGGGAVPVTLPMPYPPSSDKGIPMCQRKPGPRCHAHARPKYVAACQKLEEAEATYNAALEEAGGDRTKVPEQITHAKERAYANRYEKMKQLYSTPKARAEMKNSILPQSAKTLQQAEAAYNADPSEDNKRARTTARSEYTRNRNLLEKGERRWSQSNADLRTFEKREAALKSGDYDAARYDNVDLSRAASWDIKNTKPRWSQDRKAVRRDMTIETPTQERVRAVSTMHIAGSKTNGYTVHTTTVASYGYTQDTNQSQSALPAWQDGTKRKKDSEFSYGQPQQHHEVSEKFDSYADAKKYATERATNDDLPAKLSSGARDRAIGARMKSQGITTEAQYQEHMKKLRAQQEAAKAETAAPATR